MTEEQRWELEEELNNLEADLDVLYYQDSQLKPFVDDRIRQDIWRQIGRRDENKALLETEITHDN